MKNVLCVLILTMGACALARADTVVLKNGDKATGTLEQVSDGSLTLKSDSFGEISIPLDKVQSYTADKPAVIVKKDQTLARGQVALTATGDWQVTANGASQTVAAAAVKIILPADTYHSEVEVVSAPWQLWKGSVNLGYSFQNGDQDTNTFSLTAAATRERSTNVLFMPHLRSNFVFTMLESKAQQDGTKVSSDTISTNLREDYLFTPRNFVFGFGQIDHIDAQGLYLRQSVGGGFGRDLVSSARTTFSVLGGLNYAHEKFEDGISSQSAQVLLGEKLGMQITKRLRLDHNLNFYPDLQISGQFRFDTSTTLVFKLSTHLTANAGIIDLFLNKPAPGNHENNEAVTTGLGYTF